MLLDGQSLTIERPARTTGTAIGIAAAAFAAVLAIALLMRGLDWPVSFPQFLAYLGAGVMALVALAFAFWAWACATMHYIVGPAGVTVRWGPVTQQIPISRIQSVVHGRAEQRPQITGVGWIGYHAGRGEAPGVGPVVFYSTHRVPEDLVYVRTEDLAYGLSPQDPARFISQVERVKRAVTGGEAAEQPIVSRDFLASHPIWADRVAQWLALAAVLLNVALWGYLFAAYPDLNPEITIEFPPIGDITTLHEKSEIMKIPVTATAFLAMNLIAALLFQAKERAATYLILSGAVFFQVVFWAAAIVAVVNA